jgi:hypothetical protein
MTKKNFFRKTIAASIFSLLIAGCAKDDNSSDIISLPRDKFIGTWHVSAHGSNSGNLTWDLIIEAASASLPEGIVMKNFDQTGNDRTVPATVSGSNFAIPGTVVYPSGGGQVTIEGTGSLNGATLTLDYTSTDSQTDTVHATATK